MFVLAIKNKESIMKTVKIMMTVALAVMVTTSFAARVVKSKLETSTSHPTKTVAR